MESPHSSLNEVKQHPCRIHTTDDTAKTVHQKLDAVVPTATNTSDDSVATSPPKPVLVAAPCRPIEHLVRQHQKLQQVRRKNAIYSKRKYYKKKQYIDSLKSTKLHLLGKNQVLRSSNEALEAIIQRSHKIVALKEMVQSEQAKQELLHALSSPPPNERPDGRIDPNIVQRLPPSRYSPSTMTTNYTKLSSHRLHPNDNSSHLSFVKIPTATKLEDESAWSNLIRSFGIDASVCQRNDAWHSPFATYEEAAVAQSPTRMYLPLWDGRTGNSMGATTSLSHAFSPSNFLPSPSIASTMSLLPQQQVYQRNILDRNIHNPNNGIYPHHVSLGMFGTVNETSAVESSSAFDHRYPQSILDINANSMRASSSEGLQLFLMQQLQPTHQRRLA